MIHTAPDHTHLNGPCEARETDHFLPIVLLAQSGDADAKAQLCEQFTPLVRASARRYKGHRQIAFDDLVQCGYEHLLIAVANYEPERGVYFAHYAKVKVGGGLYGYVRHQQRHLNREVHLISDADGGGFGGGFGAAVTVGSGSGSGVAAARVGQAVGAGAGQQMGSGMGSEASGGAGSGAARGPQLDGGMGRRLARGQAGRAGLAACDEGYALAEWEDLYALLSPRERLAVEAILIAGYRSPDVARAQGVSADTVKTWRRRAVMKLRAALALT